LQYLIERFGQQTYGTTYATLSTGAMASVCWGYWKHGKGLRIWSRPPPGFAAGAFLFQALGFAGFAQLVPRVQFPVKLVGDPVPSSPEPSSPELRDDSRLGPVAASAWQPQCPMDFKGEAAAQKDGSIAGIQRVTRHPSLFSLGSLGLGTALASPFAAQAVMFSMPCLWSFIGAYHIDVRHRRGSGGMLSEQVDAQTSMVPFVALVEGRQSWEKLAQELKWSNVGLAVAVAALLAARRARAARAAAAVVAR